MAAAAREVGVVARRAGVQLGADPVALAREVALRTADNRSSMLQDIERGGLTEIDAICGAVVRAGRHLGVETPVNLRLWRRVSALGGAVVDGTGTTLRQGDFARELGLGAAEGRASGRDSGPPPERAQNSAANEHGTVRGSAASGAASGTASEDTNEEPADQDTPEGRTA
jgi:hypothetical protein